MADKLYLTIVLRKEVETIEQGKALTELVKSKLKDHPDVDVKANIGVQLEIVPGQNQLD